MINAIAPHCPPVPDPDDRGSSDGEQDADAGKTFAQLLPEQSVADKPASSGDDSTADAKRSTRVMREKTAQPAIDSTIANTAIMAAQLSALTDLRTMTPAITLSPGLTPPTPPARDSGSRAIRDCSGCCCRRAARNRTSRENGWRHAARVEGFHVGHQRGDDPPGDAGRVTNDRTRNRRANRPGRGSKPCCLVGVWRPGHADGRRLPFGRIVPRSGRPSQGFRVVDRGTGKDCRFGASRRRNHCKLQDDRNTNI